MYVQTNQSGGLPDVGLYPTGKLYCKVPAARTVSFENVTGSDTAIDLSQAAARGRPMWSYTKRTYDGATGIVSSEGPIVPIIGTITACDSRTTPRTVIPSLYRTLPAHSSP